MQNISENMSKQMVKYNNWFPNQNHEVFVQCMLKEPHIECKMSIPFPPNRVKLDYKDELVVISVCMGIMLILVIFLGKRK